MKVLHCILLLALTSVSSLALAAKTPVIGFLRVEADSYFAEQRESDPYATRVLAKSGLGFGLGEWHVFFGDQASESRTLDLLRKFHVMVPSRPRN